MNTIGILIILIFKHLYSRIYIYIYIYIYNVFIYCCFEEYSYTGEFNSHHKYIIYVS